MANWKQLERELSSWVKSYAISPIEYRGSFQSITGFPSDGFRSDGMLTDGKVLLAIEVEAGQKHPDTNVGKYWLLGRYHTYKKIVLFHIYTPDFDSYGWRKTLGEFYAEKMQTEIPFEYVLLDRRESESYDSTLKEIQAQIAIRITSEFPSVVA